VVGRKGKVGRGQAFSSIGHGPSRAAGFFPVGGRSTSVGSLLSFGRGSSRAAGLVPFGCSSSPAAPLSGNGEAAASSTMVQSGVAESPLSAASLATAVVALPERLRRHLLDSRSLHLHLQLGGARIPLVQGVPQFGNQMQHGKRVCELSLFFCCSDPLHLDACSVYFEILRWTSSSSGFFSSLNK
jgi:hypothetical protein